MALFTYHVTENLIDRTVRGFEQEIAQVKSLVTRLEHEKRVMDIQMLKHQSDDEDKALEPRISEILTRLEMAKKDLEQKQRNGFYTFISVRVSGCALTIAIVLCLFPVLFILQLNEQNQALQSQLDQGEEAEVHDDDDEEVEVEEEEPKKVEVPEGIHLPPEAQTSGGTSDRVTGVTPNKS